MTSLHVEVNGEPLRTGIELEVPFSPQDAPKWQAIGKNKPPDGRPDDDPDPTHEHSESLTWEWVAGTGFLGVGKIYGYEVRTEDGGIPLPDLPEWYRYTYNEIEEQFRAQVEPTGLFESSTAGIHFHLSPVSSDTMIELYEISQEPWFHVFTGSSIATYRSDGSETQKVGVHRSNYDDHCRVDKFDQNHASCVNKHRSGGEGHYEWRLPEPMTPDHFDLLCEFVARFLRDADDARYWAEDLVQRGDERITALRRAKECQDELSCQCSDATEATAVAQDVITGE